MRGSDLQTPKLTQKYMNLKERKTAKKLNFAEGFSAFHILYPVKSKKTKIKII